VEPSVDTPPLSPEQPVSTHRAKAEATAAQKNLFMISLLLPDLLVFLRIQDTAGM